MWVASGWALHHAGRVDTQGRQGRLKDRLLQANTDVGELGLGTARREGAKSEKEGEMQDVQNFVVWVTSLRGYRLLAGMVWVSPWQEGDRCGQVWTMGGARWGQRDRAAWVLQVARDPGEQEGRKAGAMRQAVIARQWTDV